MQDWQFCWRRAHIPYTYALQDEAQQFVLPELSRLHPSHTPMQIASIPATTCPALPSTSHPPFPITT
jgi:hypothetical protein